jgi:hypothetical protein
MDSTPLRSNLPLQAALANAFCYLISSMDDINVHVAQRATLYLGTIHDNAIKVKNFRGLCLAYHYLKFGFILEKGSFDSPILGSSICRM